MEPVCAPRPRPRWRPRWPASWTGSSAAGRAQAERTGARILAEGIETRRHVEIARTLGATLGQGWLYGRPGTLPSGTRPPRAALDLLPEPAAVEDQTPFEVVPAERVPERAPKDLLLPMSMHIEDKGLDDRDLAVRAAQPLLDRLVPAS
jgi:hypothetical protein